MKLLFVTANRIGDAMLASGVLAELCRRHPQAQVTVACGPLAAPLFEAMPQRVRTILLAKGRAKLHWLSLWLQTVGQHWDMVVDMRGSGLAWFLFASKRVRLARRDARLHRVEDAARVLGFSPPPAPALWLGAAEKRAAANLLGDGPILALGATANWSGKMWPAERFLELAERLTAPSGILPGARIAVFGGPGEHDAAAPLLAGLGGRAIDFVGTHPLPVAAAAIARATLFVGNDSGLMHVAAAGGIPTLGLFGPSDERNFGPFGPHCAFVRTAESKDELFARIDYQPTGAHSLLGSISVESVAAAAGAVLARAQQAAA
jgi:lipopolysaccharide export system permease protein